MSNPVESPEPPDKTFDASLKAATAATSSSAYALPPEQAPRRKLGEPAAPETARVVCAALIGLALGLGCGWWINVRLAATYTPPRSPARLLPDAHAAEPATTSPTTESVQVVHADTSSAHDEADPSNVSDAKAVAETVRTNPAGSEVETRRKKSGSVDDEEAPTAEPAKASVRPRGGAGPCALYASAGALNIRNGGAASLVLGTAAGQGGVAVSTPDWAHIAVFSEGRAGGGKGWLKYSVRSVSKRAGSYRLHVRSPCGSQNIPVTVSRP